MNYKSFPGASVVYMFLYMRSILLRFSFLFFLLSFFFSVHAQKTIGSLHLKQGDVLINENTSEEGVRNEVKKGWWKKEGYFILVFDAKPGVAQLKRLAVNGIEFLHYLPDHAYQVRSKVYPSAVVLKDAGVKSVVQLPGEYKYGKELSLFLKQSFLTASTVKVSVQLMPGIDVAEVLPVLKQSGFSLTSDQFINRGLLIGTISGTNIKEIATMPFISYLNQAHFTPQQLNHRERAVYGLTALTANQGVARQLNGNGITAGVGDNADPTSHLDNTTNAVNRNPSLISSSAHGTLVSSIVSGDGIIQERLTGVAPASFVITDFFDFILTKTPAYVADYGLTVTNNSYFNGLSGCAGNGDYNELSAYIDGQLFDNPYLQHIFAVGNDGTLTCTPYPTGFGTVKSGYQTAKNVLSVGSFNLVVNIISGFSSKGPVSDGRIKPEILASGGQVEGTNINNGYYNNTGTSFAAPGVTGIWTLLTQRYKQLYGSNPKSGLLKNVLCNTANDIGNPGPDYRAGFGFVNAQRAVQMLEQNRYYSNTVSMGGNHTQVIAVPAGTRQLKVMLYWHDREGLPNNVNALENDLDLTVTDGSVYEPWILNPAPGSVNNNAVRGADHLNNIEQVTIDNPGTSVSINVNGFNVTGSQEFFVTYEFVQPELTLLYPYGGERFSSFASSGRQETISWEANDVSTDTYRLEYSLDDGGTWQLIADGIAAADFRYFWTVPAVNSNKAKVRIKRTSGSVYSTSPGNFVIADQPTLSATVPCEGYVDLTWSAVTGATDYQVMQLVNGVLTNIATTASLNHRVSGLDRNTTYWFSIRPRLTDSVARRADARSILPRSSSPCTDAFFDNDLKIDTILSSINGRRFTATALSAAHPVTVRIKNLDNAASSTSYTVSYQVNGGAVINENPGISIAAGGTLDYTFSTTFDFSAAGVYSLRVFVKQINDLRTENDEVVYTVRHLDNAPVALPHLDDFETTGDDTYRTNRIGLTNAERFDFQPNSTNGRLRTFINSSMQINGNRSLYLDATQFTGALNTNSLLATYNMTSYLATPGLRLDFKFRNQGQLNLNATGVWMRGEDNQPWVLAYNLSSNQGELGEIKQVSLNIEELLAAAGQSLSSSFQLRFDQTGMASSNNGTYMAEGADIDDGFSFDDIRISAAVNDLTVTQIVAPSVFSCGAGAAATITIRVQNTSATTFNNVPVYYRIDNGVAVAGTIPSIAGNSTIDYSFTTNADLSQFKTYEIDAWTQLPSDNYPSNDSINNWKVYNSPVINSYPYLQRFESNDGNFFTTGSYSSWKWGQTDALTRSRLRRAANGNNAWFTALSGTYKNNENSYLYSPCFDLSSLTNPVLSFAHISQQEDNFDFHTVEYSIDNGVTWQRLGVQNGGTNWFTAPTNIWLTSLQRWHVSSVPVPTTASSVRFRFLLYSDVFVQREGIGIDDIHIGEAQTIYAGSDVTGLTQNITGGSNWIPFTSGGNMIAAVNPLGQNLGNTTVSVYFNTSGVVRTANNQYYLDRNIVIRPTNPLTDSVAVRFYFTEQEAATMINATNCGSCTNITDAFIAGVTKFTGTNPATENGTLLDNNSGSYAFLTPAEVDIIPYNNGYYAEFKVRSFSEFWINSGGNNQSTPLPVTLVEFTGTKRLTHVDLKWQTQSESNTSHFELERRIDAVTNFEKIKEVKAAGTTAQPQYYASTDEDALLKGQRLQYRLKMVDLDGKYTYSPIVTIQSAATGMFIENVYNNNGAQLQIVTGNKSGIREMNIRITTAAGQTVLQQQRSYANTLININGLAAGIYFMEIRSREGDVFTQKFIKQ